MTIVASYGRPAGTREDPAGMGGAVKARDEWWNGQKKNDADQAAIQGGADYASQQAQNAQNAGPAVTENAGLAQNEASGAGGHQQGAIGLAGTLANGSMPSQAAIQLQSGLNQASDMQTSMGRSARGGAALATAGANAQANTANLQQNAFAQGGLLRSKDMATGRGLLGTALGQARGQDQSRLDQANAVNQYNSDFRDKSALAWGNAAVGFGDVGNAQQRQDFGWYQGGMQSIDAQSEADQQGQEWLADAEKQRVAAAIEDD